MQHLISAAQPRVKKPDFVRLLRHMGDSTKKAKDFAKNLYEEYRTKACTMAEAYKRFDEFSEQAVQSVGGEDLPDLNPMELQLCYDEYREDEEVRQVWEESGVETNIQMQTMFAPHLNGNSRSTQSPSSKAEAGKGKKLKASEIAEMQELMVDEMKRMTDQAMRAVMEEPGKPKWKAEVTIQMVQSLASAAVERRYGVSAEEMTLGGFQHAATLQKNERFAKASEKQQDILRMLARLCGQDSA